MSSEPKAPLDYEVKEEKKPFPKRVMEWMKNHKKLVIPIAIALYNEFKNKKKKK